MKTKMRRNKYLEELGMPIEKYGTNHIYERKEDLERYIKSGELHKWLAQEEQYGLSEVETWALDLRIMEQIYTRLCMYKEIAGEFIDLTFNKFMINGQEKTEEQCIDMIIKALGRALVSNYEDFGEYDREEVEAAFKVLGIILPSLWW